MEYNRTVIESAHWSRSRESLPMPRLRKWAANHCCQSHCCLWAY